VADAASTTLTSYGALQTCVTPAVGCVLAGPAVTSFTVPASGSVLVILTAQVQGSTGNSAGFMSVSATCSTGPGVTASDANTLRVAGNDAIRASATSLITGLTPGASCTFTSVYKLSGSGFATFGARNIVVIPA